MTYTYKFATININGIASHVRLRMLEEFLRQQDIDFALLQEVTHTNLTTFRRYTAHVSVGTDKRGTAILAKEGLALNDVNRLPSGRGIAAHYNGIIACGKGGNMALDEKEPGTDPPNNPGPHPGRVAHVPTVHAMAL
jgi:hypothetical protein